jgi:S-adenosylmethionine:tRNA ribosyltransferase-isomerase
MKLSDFDFDLPGALIATRPVRPRSASRMMVVHGARIDDRHVFDLTEILRPGDRLVLNNTRVIPARLFGLRHRQSAQGPVQARIEVTLLDPDRDGCWQALVKPLKKLKIGEEVVFSERMRATLVRKDEGAAILRFNLSGDGFDAALEEVGMMPLPPYIAAKRAADARDKQDYQTVFASRDGAVAAPTASLHFDRELMARLEAAGVEFTYVTLHVGAGTFLPVKVDDVSRHKMHSEWGEVGTQAVGEIAATRKAGGRIIPGGTTALRLIEAAAHSGELEPWRGETDIFIRPGYRFRVADALMTNFHLPKSTLMMLVSALMGTQNTRDFYRHAIENRYRFFSYGDSSILFPQG